MDIKLPNENICFSQNEIFCHHTLNSNFNKLLENDKAIYESYKELYSNLNITDYDSNKKDYKYGDLVWWQSKNHNNQLYLLKNIIEDNPYNPYIPQSITSEYLQSQYLLQFGWYNENDRLNIVNLGIKDELSSMVDNVITPHQQDKDYHPFGIINPQNIDEKLLRKDMSNIDIDRDNVFFPNATYNVEQNKYTIKGYYRTYDNGVLEYDILFKFGNSSNNDAVTIFGSKSELSANNTTIKSTGGVTTITGFDNRKYFYNVSNCNIFQYNNLSEKNYSKIGNLIQRNRNDYVNVYTATIYFPKIFRNKDYMVFSNTILSQSEYTDSGEKYLVPSQNEIVFCNKTFESITAINVTYPNSLQYENEGYNASHGGLASNSFHCKIIGLGE